MKKTLKRLISLLLTAVLVFGFTPLSLAAAALSGGELTTYTDKADNYDPNKDGFYGYIEVRMENGDGFELRNLACLVKNGHVLVSASEFGSLSDELYPDTTSTQACFSPGYRTIFFSAGSAQADFVQGDYMARYSLDTACVSQDDELWIPLQDACVLCGMNYHDLVDSRISISEPGDNILDTYLEILSMETGTYDFRDAYLTGNEEEDKKVNKALERMGVSAHVVDNLDGMLHLELDKWLDSAWEVVTLGFGETNLTDSDYIKDVMEDVLNATADEASCMEESSGAFALELAGLLSSAGEGVADLTTLKVDQAFNLILKDKYYTVHATPKTMTQLSSLSVKASKAAKFCSAAGDVLDSLSYVLSAVDLVYKLNQQDELAEEGMQYLVEVMETNSNPSMSATAREACSSAVATYGGGTGRATAYWFGSNLNTLASTGIHAYLGVVALPLDSLNLACELVPGYRDSIDTLESFRKALTAMELAQDTRTAAKSFLGNFYSNGCFEPDQMEANLAVLYAWLKVCYVTRLAGMNAMDDISDTLGFQQEKHMLQQEAEWLAAITAYTDEGFIDPSEMQSALDDATEDGLSNYVVPAYVRVYGTVTDAVSGEELTNVKLTIENEHEGLKLEKTVDGEFEFYIPLTWENMLAERNSVDPTSVLGAMKVTAEHSDYEEPLKVEFKDYGTREFGSGSIPAYEFQIEMNILFGQVDYYRYIRDNMLPEFGYASLDEISADLTQYDLYQGDQKEWNYGDGLISAAIADFNSDDVDECIVLRREGESIYFETLYIKGGQICWTRAEEASAWIDIRGYDFNWIGVVEVDENYYLYVQNKYSNSFVTGVGDSYKFFRIREGELYEAAGVSSYGSGDYYGYRVTVPVGTDDTVTYDHDQEWPSTGKLTCLKNNGFDVGSFLTSDMTWVYDTWTDIETMCGMSTYTGVMYSAVTASYTRNSVYACTSKVKDESLLRQHIEELDS